MVLTIISAGGPDKLSVSWGTNNDQLYYQKTWSSIYKREFNYFCYNLTSLYFLSLPNLTVCGKYKSIYYIVYAVSLPMFGILLSHLFWLANILNCFKLDKTYFVSVISLICECLGHECLLFRHILFIVVLGPMCQKANISNTCIKDKNRKLYIATCNMQKQHIVSPNNIHIVIRYAKQIHYLFFICRPITFELPIVWFTINTCISKCNGFVGFLVHTATTAIAVSNNPNTYNNTKELITYMLNYNNNITVNCYRVIV